MEEKQMNEAYAEAELEGGDRFYWYVCEECGTMINKGTEVCPTCKRRIRWE